MNTSRTSARIIPIVEQTTNNTTSWIGQLPGQQQLTKGQTFKAPAEGDIETIEVFSELVSHDAKIVMTLHDVNHDNWGPALGTSKVECQGSDNGKWIAFDLPVHIQKGKTYGFKLISEKGFIGVGEAVGDHRFPPMSDGQEWKFNGSQQGDAFSYFSLAFRVGLRA